MQLFGLFSTSIVVLFNLFGSFAAHAADDSLADDVIGNLAIMKTVYRAEYAPADWKKQFTDYDLNTEYDKAVAAVKANPKFTLKDSRLVFKNFVYAMRDYHTSISFVATEMATLPLNFASAGDKVFLVYVDRTKLPEAKFPFHVGDELVGFGGKPAVQALTDVQAEVTANVPATDRVLAERYFTARTAARGYNVPQGRVTLEFRPKGAAPDSTPIAHQTEWIYTPEKIAPRDVLTRGTERLREMQNVKTTSMLHRPQMSVDYSDAALVDSPYTLGARKTFTPALGPKIWESADTDFFYAYIFKTPDGKDVGYIRIASYEAPDYPKALAEFASVMERFETFTNSIVIDEVNNPGGSVFYLYALASMLSNKPLTTPLHKMALTQSDVNDAYVQIAILEGVQTDADAVKLMNPAELDGYPASYELAKLTLDFAHFIVNEWKAGRKLTNPYFLGVDHINPAPVHYTKPILVLTNHLDFSGADFFPAILQDNKRITILGSRTAGAGGYVNDVKVPNNVGIAAFRCTESIAVRADGNYLENLGVTPDIKYEMTEADLTHNYAPYVKTILSTLNTLK